MIIVESADSLSTPPDTVGGEFPTLGESCSSKRSAYVVPQSQQHLTFTINNSIGDI